MERPTPERLAEIRERDERVDVDFPIEWQTPAAQDRRDLLAEVAALQGERDEYKAVWEAMAENLAEEAKSHFTTRERVASLQGEVARLQREIEEAKRGIFPEADPAKREWKPSGRSIPLEMDWPSDV